MQPPADFAASIAYLEDLTAHPLLPPEQAGLDRVRFLLKTVGDPQRAFATIQVAGTNGKGSTTTIAATILRQAGHCTGAFTSPHLQSYRERIAIDGVPIDEGTWVRNLQRLHPWLTRMEVNEVSGYALGRPAFLEVLWTMACLAFVERGVRCAAVETGMGGRLDPTTINAASVAVITNVSMDHVERLGRTVEAIAAEKAGLIKPGQVVISAASPAALEVIEATCKERGATLWAVGDEGAVRIEGADEGGLGTPFTVHTPVRTHVGLRPGLRGAHQRLNVACAIGAVDALAAQPGIAVPAEAVVAGVAGARIPGRLETIAGCPEIVLDGAHNAAGAAALASSVRALYKGRRIVLLLGILGNKDIATITDLLSPLAEAIVVTEPPFKSRTGFAGVVAEQASRHCDHVEEVDEPIVALARARSLARPEDILLVAGSLYLVGAVRDIVCPVNDIEKSI